MDAGGDLTNSLIGELMLAVAAKKNLGGVVINGAIRDSGSIRCIMSSSTRPSGAPNEHDSAIRGWKFLSAQVRISWGLHVSASPERATLRSSLDSISRRFDDIGSLWIGNTVSELEAFFQQIPTTMPC